MDTEVIDQKHVEIDYSNKEGVKLIFEDKNKLISEEKKNENQKDNHNRCVAIKKNGKRCRQMGKKNQSGGEIINGYCSFHRDKSN